MAGSLRVVLHSFDHTGRAEEHSPPGSLVLQCDLRFSVGTRLDLLGEHGICRVVVVPMEADVGIALGSYDVSKLEGIVEPREDLVVAIPCGSGANWRLVHCQPLVQIQGDDLLDVRFDKVVERVEVLLDQAADLEEGRDQTPLVLGRVDGIREPFPP